MSRTNDPEISLVTPCYNEQEVIAEVVWKSVAALEKLDRTWELIVVDNHSSDSTPDRVREIIEREQRVRLIVHDRNRYYSGSCQTALDSARGAYVAIMDSDDQFTAADLPAFLNALENGSNLVFGWRKIRHDPVSRKVMSKVFNSMATSYLGWNLHDLNVGIRMFDRRFIESASIRHTLNMANPELFVRAKIAGLTVSEVPCTHSARTKGQSCHEVSKLWKIFTTVKNYFDALQNDLRQARKTTRKTTDRVAA